MKVSLEKQYFNMKYLEDSFFTTLKEDYDFLSWFQTKEDDKEQFTCAKDNGKIIAFFYIKEKETEKIVLQNSILEKKTRTKIGTFKLDDSRIGGLGFADHIMATILWKWKNIGTSEIYITIFDKYKPLINLVESFGFENIGRKKDGELVFVKNDISKNDNKKNFPFVRLNSMSKGNILPIEPMFYDKLLPYPSSIDIDVFNIKNSITKIYIAFPSNPKDFKEKFKKNNIVFLYKKSEQDKKNKSKISSYGMINNTIIIKDNSAAQIDGFDNFDSLLKGKSIFDHSSLREWFDKKPNIVIIEFTFFGDIDKESRISWNWLEDRRIFDGHPYSKELSLSEVKEILKESKLWKK